MNSCSSRWLYTRNLGHQFIRNLKDRSDVTMRLWTYQCEYIFAQKICKGQRFYTFYSKFTAGNAFKNFFQTVRCHLVKSLQRRCNGFLLSSIGGLIVFDWNKERITYDSVKNHATDVEYAKNLKKQTLYCGKCKKKLPIFEKSTSKDFCQCPEGERIINPSIWEPYIQRDGMIIWRKLEKSSLYSYKVYATYKDITANDFLRVQTDLEYRKVWDENVVKLEVIDTDPVEINGSEIIYWELKWPKLFANRDYVYCRKYFVDSIKKIMIVVSTSTKHPKAPLDPNKQRIDEYWSYMVIKPLSSFHEPGLEFVLTYFDNPGLAIPATITTWVAQKQMPEFLKQLYIATKNYSMLKQLSSKRLALHNKEDDSKRYESDKHKTRLSDTQNKENQMDENLIM